MKEAAQFTGMRSLGPDAVYEKQTSFAIIAAATVFQHLQDHGKGMPNAGHDQGWYENRFPRPQRPPQRTAATGGSNVQVNQEPRQNNVIINSNER